MEGLNDKTEPGMHMLEEEHVKLREWKIQSHLGGREAGAFRNERNLQVQACSV